MTYITFNEYSDAPGRQYREVCTDPATGAYACEVDEVLDGETEISANEYERTRQAADAWYEAHPVIDAPTPEPVPPTKTFEELVAEADSFAALKALVLANARP